MLNSGQSRNNDIQWQTNKPQRAILDILVAAQCPNKPAGSKCAAHTQYRSCFEGKCFSTEA